MNHTDLLRQELSAVPGLDSLDDSDWQSLAAYFHGPLPPRGVLRSFFEAFRDVWLPVTGGLAARLEFRTPSTSTEQCLKSLTRAKVLERVFLSGQEVMDAKISHTDDEDRAFKEDATQKVAVYHLATGFRKEFSDLLRRSGVHEAIQSSAGLHLAPLLERLGRAEARIRRI